MSFETLINSGDDLPNVVKAVKDLDTIPHLRRLGQTTGQRFIALVDMLREPNNMSAWRTYMFHFHVFGTGDEQSIERVRTLINNWRIIERQLRKYSPLQYALRAVWSKTERDNLRALAVQLAIIERKLSAHDVMVDTMQREIDAANAADFERRTEA